MRLKCRSNRNEVVAYLSTWCLTLEVSDEWLTEEDQDKQEYFEISEKLKWTPSSMLRYATF